MKTLKHLSLIIAVLTIISCNDDFLDRTPPTSVSDTDFWKTEIDVKNYANNWYNTLLPRDASDLTTAGLYTADATGGSDDYADQNPNGNLLGTRTIPASGGGWSFSNVRNVNYFLENYKRCSEPFDKIQMYVGEAYFFRASVYFNLMKTFGDLPWIDTTLGIDDDKLYSPRISRGIITDNILADLDKAIEYIPTKASAKPGRLNKEIAMALKARIALYEGTWEKYHAGTAFGVVGSDGKKLLEIAATTSKAIIDTGLFGLDNTSDGNVRGYHNLFNKNSHTGSKEVMFYGEYDASLSLGNKWGYIGSTGEGRGLTKTFVDDYLCTDGQPIAVSTLYQGDKTLIDVVTNRDPRLDQTIRVNDTKHPMTTGITPILDFLAPTMHSDVKLVCWSGYQRFKGTTPDYSQQQGNKSDLSYIIFRYAEVLLIYAEAKAELGTIAQEDIDISINLLRGRVKMPNLVLANIVTDPNWLFPTLSPIINEVRRERHVELALEGYRHDDIWRWAACDELIVGKSPVGAYREQWAYAGMPTTNPLYKIYKQVYDTYKNVDANKYVVIYTTTALPGGYSFKIERDYLSPIPLDQIAVSGYKQNPGWW